MKAALGITIGVLLYATPGAIAQSGECDGGCTSDITGDNVVDVADLLAVLGDWGCMDCPDTDLDGDGVVATDDLLLVLGDWGCGGFDGPVGTISGYVTNAWTGDPIAEATVLVGACPLVTDMDGMYTGTFPADGYDLEYSATNFISAEDSAVLFPDITIYRDVALDPVAAVVVNIIVDGEPNPGDTVSAMAEVIVLDGSMITDFAWSQIDGAPAVLDPVDADSTMVDLGASLVYKGELIEILKTPPIAPEDLPPNIPPPPGDYPSGLQDRYEVVGINPWAIERAGVVTLEVDVTTTSGTYSAEGEVHTHLPWKSALGIRTVGVGRTVLLNSKDQASYDWTFQTPAGSGTTLLDATTPYPEFTPDIPGLYSATVTDLESGQPVDVFVFAGTWRGTIVGQDADGRPVPEGVCLNCHFPGGVAEDQFTPWIQTGHAEIFTNNLNESPYWGERCFECHTVGYDLDVDNNGIDDQPDFFDFLDSGLIGNPPGDDWTEMLASYPDTAMRANIQCENCHGPHNGEPGLFGPAHTQELPRVSLSSDVCAVCHGEPARHARFQQWQLSGHANYEVAIDESGSGNCSRCHTANGFLAWLPILLGDAPGDPLDNITVTWTSDEAHPQTCVTCHDPHSIGTESGIDNNATVRIAGNTPPLIAGFTAYGVGRGAICMTCHNSRRGLRNDDTFDQFFGTPEAARAPHGSSQTDLLMGENAYLVQTGIRGNHSFLADTCTSCHMVETPPPADLSYNQSGTNHTFFAGTDVCAECHTGFDADTIQTGIHDNLDVLQILVEGAILDLMIELTDAGNTLDFDGDVLLSDANDIEEILFGEYRGRQAVTITVGGMDSGPFRMTDIDVLDPGMVVIGQLYDFADPALIKSGWNWALVHNDGSLGVHNPSFAFNTLAAGIEALDPTGAIQWPDWLTYWDPAGDPPRK